MKKRNNENHPWKKAFSWKTVKEQKETKNQMEKLKIK